MKKTHLLYAFILLLTSNVFAVETIKSWRFHNNYNATVKLPKAKKSTHLNLAFNPIEKKYFIELFIDRKDADVQKRKKAQLVTKKNGIIDLKFEDFSEAPDRKKAGFNYCYKWTFSMKGDASKNAELLSEIKLTGIKFGVTSVNYYWDIPIKDKKVFGKLLEAVKLEQTKKSSMIEFRTALRNVNFTIDNKKVNDLDFIQSEKGKSFKPLRFDVGTKVAVYHDKLEIKPPHEKSIQVTITKKKVTGNTKQGPIIESNFTYQGTKFVFIQDGKTYRFQLANTDSHEFNFQEL